MTTRSLNGPGSLAPGRGTPYHHGSHRNLLWSPADSSLDRQGVNAIIVPTARRPAHLSEAANLSLALNCTLVTMHSGKWTSAAEATQRLPAGIDLIAIDVPEPARLRLPCWETSRLLAGTVFARRTDLSAKRNLALMLGHMLGWSRILFVDDDITALNPDDARKASSLLDTYNAVGLQITGFPDNSVVCHAYRQAGGEQQSFIGGGALAVEVNRSNSFFPDIYNDDWFACLMATNGCSPPPLPERLSSLPTTRSGVLNGPAPKSWATCCPKGSTGCWTRTVDHRRRPGSLGRVPDEAPSVRRGRAGDGGGRHPRAE